jgi:ribonuclease-3 family protein
MDYFHLSVPADDIRNISNLGLAYLGDGVYELMVRTWLCLHGKATNHGLHKAAVKYVAAPAQAQMAEKIISLLDEEEQDVFRRGRNTRPHSIPRNAKREDYQTATAVECLFGYLYLKGKNERLNELFETMMGD